MQPYIGQARNPESGGYASSVYEAVAAPAAAAAVAAADPTQTAPTAAELPGLVHCWMM